MNKEKLNHFRQKLEDEKKLLVEELSTIATQNPNNPDDWELKYLETNLDKAEFGDVADEIEVNENNMAILHNLEIKYSDVIHALSKVENGTYGICEVSGDEIEEDRLEANPSARTCKAHMN